MTWDKTLPLDSADAKDGPADIRTMKTDVQTALQVEHTFPGAVVATPCAYHKIGYGATGARPAAGYANRWYYNTTTGTIQRDTGSAWEDITSILNTIPAGTLMPFPQATAPTGWTLDTTHNDKMLRVVSGSGGGTAGSWTTTLDTQNHYHFFSEKTISGSSLSHSYTTILTDVSVPNDPIVGYTSSGANYITHYAGQSYTHNHSNLANYGHANTWNSAWRPKYLDVIVCSKD